MHSLFLNDSWLIHKMWFFFYLFWIYYWSHFSHTQDKMLVLLSALFPSPAAWLLESVWRKLDGFCIFTHVMLSPDCHFDIPPPLNRFIWFSRCRTELGEYENLLSDHQCLHLSLSNRFLTGGCRKNNFKNEVLQRGRRWKLRH